MGFPTEFFPVLFAIPRMAGYLSHWKESLNDPDTKIMRPAQVNLLLPPLVFCYHFRADLRCQKCEITVQLDIKLNKKTIVAYAKSAIYPRILTLIFV